MGRIVEFHKHSYAGKTFDGHVFSIQKRLAKSLSREKVYFTVVFVGETHNTIDERRRAQVFGFRPSSAALRTVVERGMGMPTTGENLIIEPMSSLSPFDLARNTNVVGQIADAYKKSPFRVLLILFGEDHEDKIRPLMEADHTLPAMNWHFYPSFSDYLVANNRVYPPYDPRAAGYTLVGMVRIVNQNEIDLRQLTEGIMPTTGVYRIPVMSPFSSINQNKEYAVFVRGPWLEQIQNSLELMRDAYLQVSLSNIRDIRLLDLAGTVRPVPADLKDKRERQDLIEAFWADAR